MRWKFWRADDDLSYLPRTNGEEANLANENATRVLRDAHRESAETSRIALRLRELRERNHFAELIASSISEVKE